MTKDRTVYHCRDCGAPALRWAGRCATCGEWNTLEQEVAPTAPSRGAGPAVPVSLASLGGDGEPPRSTGIDELDRVLGGGLVDSSVTLVAGEPGTGKSTLLLQLLAGVAASGGRSLLVSAEEAPEQIGRRAARLGLATDGLFVLGETDLGAIRSAMGALRPDVVVVDSIQTIFDPATGAAGSVPSVRACAAALAQDAKCPGGPAVVLVGHVTKDGSIAGPRVLEHLVDTVLSFEGDRHHALRILRAVKHRFGPVGELGMWEMTAGGLVEVPDATALLLADRRPGTPGSVVFAGLDGRQPLLTEVQALVVPAPGGPARRSASGYDQSRLAQLLAVLDRRAGVDLRQHDVYVSAVGGVRLTDPGSDLAVACALVSALTGRSATEDMVVMGEVGLGGELRHAPQTARRLAEAHRLGFRSALVPARSEGGGPTGLTAMGIATLAEAIDVALAAAPVRPPRLRVLGGSALGTG